MIIDTLSHTSVNYTKTGQKDFSMTYSLWNITKYYLFICRNTTKIELYCVFQYSTHILKTDEFGCHGNVHTFSKMSYN